jgi:hypothetical protein
LSHTSLIRRTRTASRREHESSCSSPWGATLWPPRHQAHLSSNASHACVMSQLSCSSRVKIRYRHSQAHESPVTPRGQQCTPSHRNPTGHNNVLKSSSTGSGRVGEESTKVSTWRARAAGALSSRRSHSTQSSWSSGEKRRVQSADSTLAPVHCRSYRYGRAPQQQCKSTRV